MIRTIGHSRESCSRIAHSPLLTRYYLHRRKMDRRLRRVFIRRFIVFLSLCGLAYAVLKASYALAKY